MRWGSVIGLPLAWVALAAPGLGEGPGAPLFAAHRGGSLLWPENSLRAFRGALGLGADFIEFDVHLTSDDEVVVIHDATLDRTTTGQGPVRERPLASLKAVHLKDRAGAVLDETVPTLGEVTAIAAESRRRMLLEIKVDERGQRYPGIEEKVFAVLDRYRMAGSTVVMAFEPATWRRLRELRPDVAAGALYSPRTLRTMGSTVARELQSARDAGVGLIGFQHTLVDADTVAAARTAGLVLGAWTVNEPDALRRLIEVKVGVLITDRPDLAKTLLGR